MKMNGFIKVRLKKKYKERFHLFLNDLWKQRFFIQVLKRRERDCLSHNKIANHGVFIGIRNDVEFYSLLVFLSKYEDLVVLDLLVINDFVIDLNLIEKADDDIEYEYELENYNDNYWDDSDEDDSDEDNSDDDDSDEDDSDDDDSYEDDEDDDLEKENFQNDDVEDDYIKKESRFLKMAENYNNLREINYNVELFNIIYDSLNDKFLNCYFDLSILLHIIYEIQKKKIKV